MAHSSSIPGGSSKSQVELVPPSKTAPTVLPLPDIAKSFTDETIFLKTAYKNELAAIEKQKEKLESQMMRLFDKESENKLLKHSETQTKDTTTSIEKLYHQYNALQKKALQLKPPTDALAPEIRTLAKLLSKIATANESKSIQRQSLLYSDTNEMKREPLSHYFLLILLLAEYEKSSIVSCFIYIDRLLKATQDTFNLKNGKRLLLMGFWFSGRMLADITWDHKTHSLIGKISKQELIALECELVDLANFNFHVSPQEYQACEAIVSKAIEQEQLLDSKNIVSGAWFRFPVLSNAPVLHQQEVKLIPLPEKFSGKKLDSYLSKDSASSLTDIDKSRLSSILQKELGASLNKDLSYYMPDYLPIANTPEWRELSDEETALLLCILKQRDHKLISFNFIQDFLINRAFKAKSPPLLTLVVVFDLLRESTHKKYLSFLLFHAIKKKRSRIIEKILLFKNDFNIHAKFDEKTGQLSNSHVAKSALSLASMINDQPIIDQLLKAGCDAKQAEQDTLQLKNGKYSKSKYFPATKNISHWLELPKDCLDELLDYAMENEEKTNTTAEFYDELAIKAIYRDKLFLLKKVIKRCVSFPRNDMLTLPRYVRNPDIIRQIILDDAAEREELLKASFKASFGAKVTENMHFIDWQGPSSYDSLTQIKLKFCIIERSFKNQPTVLISSFRLCDAAGTKLGEHIRKPTNVEIMVEFIKNNTLTDPATQYAWAYDLLFQSGDFIQASGSQFREAIDSLKWVSIEFDAEKSIPTEYVNPTTNKMVALFGISTPSIPLELKLDSTPVKLVTIRLLTVDDANLALEKDAEGRRTLVERFEKDGTYHITLPSSGVSKDHKGTMPTPMFFPPAQQPAKTAPAKQNPTPAAQKDNKGSGASLA